MKVRIMRYLSAQKQQQCIFFSIQFNSISSDMHIPQVYHPYVFLHKLRDAASTF